MIIIYLPGNPGIKLRSIVYKRKFKSFGENVYIDSGVQFLNMHLISLGSNIHIDKNCIIQAGIPTTGKNINKPNSDYQHCPGELIIGNNVHIVQQCIIMAFGGVQIGDKCVLSAGTKLYAQSNLAYDPDERSKVISLMPYEESIFINSPVVLKENVWIGLNCSIMPGTTVGQDSFAKTNSVLKGVYENNSYLDGNPATKTRNRFETK